MFFVVGLIGLTWFFANYLDRRARPNRNLEFGPDAPGEVVLRSDRQGHYFAPGLINGHPVNFLLDTGASIVSVPAHLAAQIRLESGAPGLANTANGVVVVYDTVLDQVRLGGIELNKVRGNINPAMNDDTVLLGMSFMRNLDLTQRNGVLTLRYPADR